MMSMPEKNTLNEILHLFNTQRAANKKKICLKKEKTRKRVGS